MKRDVIWLLIIKRDCYVSLLIHFIFDIHGYVTCNYRCANQSRGSRFNKFYVMYHKNGLLIIVIIPRMPRTIIF